MKNTKLASYVTTVFMTLLFAMAGSMRIIMPPPMVQLFHDLGLFSLIIASNTALPVVDVNATNGTRFYRFLKQ